MSIDPLWEKYLSLSPYHYSANNPVNAYDVDGRDLIMLIHIDGAGFIPIFPMGHTANLIEPDETGGYDYFSKDGTEENGGVYGESVSEHTYFNSFEEFLNSPDALHSRYDYGYRIKTTPKEDKKMKEASKKQVESSYSLSSDSCADTPSAALHSIKKPYGAKSSSTEYYKRRYGYGNPVPLGRYKDIKKGNPNGQEYDLNRMRTEGVPNS